MIKISPNFSLREMFTESFPVNVVEYELVITNLYRILTTILEKVRAQFGVPITITSGYRSESHNRKIGGSVSSQHCKGEAIDFIVKDKTLMPRIYDWIAKNCTYDQLIWESGGKWVHVSLKESNNRQQTLSL